MTNILKKIANQDKDDSNDFQFGRGWFITKKIHERTGENQIERESAANKNWLFDIVRLNTMMNHFNQNLKINSGKRSTLLLIFAKRYE